MQNKKLIIFSAPSGSGKTTIVKYLLKEISSLSFSISCTTRQPRNGEVDGVDYYYLNQEDFEQKIDNQEFAEFEEVYPGKYYGTLKSEIQRIWAEGKSVVFDIDAKGGINLKKVYPEETLSIFLAPPSIEELESRLRNRNTEDEEALKTRMRAARIEMELSSQFDLILVNDDLEKTKQKAMELVQGFIQS